VSIIPDWRRLEGTAHESVMGMNHPPKVSTLPTSGNHPTVTLISVIDPAGLGIHPRPWLNAMRHLLKCFVP
jgi:hypothetical protein